jgi:hypothetical protein
MKKTRIIEPTAGLIAVISDEADYECHHDPVTDDWQVTSSNDNGVQGTWLLTKDDAIKYALERAGVIEDANYQRAPDRTSA